VGKEKEMGSSKTEGGTHKELSDNETKSNKRVTNNKKAEYWL
jgi:hypothetical protein